MISILIILFFLTLINKLEAQENVNHYLNNGNQFCESGNYVLGIIEYLKALKIEPNNFVIHNNIAIAYLKNSFLNTSISELEENGFDYLKDNEEFNIFFESVSFISREQKRFFKDCSPCSKKFNEIIKDALYHFEKAKELNPSAPQPYYNCGIIYLRKGNYKKSLENFLKVKDYYVNDKWYFYFLACNYSALGNKKEAISNLWEALKNGFNNRVLIEYNDEFNNIENEPEFIKIRTFLNEKNF